MEQENEIPWFLISNELPPRGLEVFVWKEGSPVVMASRPTVKELEILNDVYEREFSEKTFDNSGWFYPIDDWTHWAYMVAKPYKQKKD